MRIMWGEPSDDGKRQVNSTGKSVLDSGSPSKIKMGEGFVKLMLLLSLLAFVSFLSVSSLILNGHGLSFGSYTNQL